VATITQYIELPTPNIKLDHCVIHVPDWARSNAFYGDVLGAEVAPRSSGWAYHFGREQLNLHGPGVVFAPAYAARRLWPMLDRFVGFTAQPVREAQAVAFLDTLLAREAQEHSTEVRHDVWDPSAG
jgi:catechol 2,3-dioxygenase-like lactoylglutathione lyase family enzyme